jgi:hypothetical protein
VARRQQSLFRLKWKHLGYYIGIGDYSFQHDGSTRRNDGNERSLKLLERIWKKGLLKYVFILFLFHLAFSPSVNYVFSENSAETYARVIVIPSLL